MATLSQISTNCDRWVTPQIILFAVALLSLPFWIEAVGLYQYLGIEIAIWIIFALGFNLLFGYAGLHSFGHGAYLGIGAYAFGYFQHNLGISLIGGLAAAVVTATLAGAVVAVFLSHRRGIYFALMTIAFGQVFWFAAIKLHWLTGGEDGMLNIPRPALDVGIAQWQLDDNRALYFLIAGLTILATILCWRTVNAPFGRILQAIRQNETRAAFIGYDVWWFKMAAFTISAMFAGLAGGLFAMAQESAYPDTMSLHQSGLIVMMVLVGGGLVNFWGPILGVVLYYLARDILGSITETWLLWYGLMFVAMVMFKPEGLAGLVSDLKFGSGESSTPAPKPLAKEV
jgi:branched-chain amino acid transport system permease protein